MKPAKVDLEAGTVTCGNTKSIRRIQKVIGPFVIHKGFERWPYYSVTVPTGSTLGFYQTKAKAVAAAEIMKPLIVNAEGQTLEELFGTMENARNAYNAIRSLR